MLKIITLLIFLFPSVCFANTWTHYEPPSNKNEIHININNNKPKYVPQNVYQWIPYIVNEPVVVEKRCLLIKRYEIEYRPTTRWVLQPIVIMP